MRRAPSYRSSSPVSGGIRWLASPPPTAVEEIHPRCEARSRNLSTQHRAEDHPYLTHLAFRHCIGSLLVDSDDLLQVIASWSLYNTTQDYKKTNKSI